MKLISDFKTDAEELTKKIELQNNELKLEINERFNSIANNIPGHIAYINANTLIYEFANNELQKSFGIPLEKIIGSHIIDIIGDENYQFALKYIEEVKKGKPGSYESYFNFSTGKRLCKVNYVPIFGKNNDVVSIGILVYDITEIRHAEQVSKFNQRFNTLADNIPGYIGYINAKTLKYEFVNKAYQKAYGIPYEKIIGSHISDILGEKDYQFALKYIEEAKAGKSVSYENVFKLNTGNRWVRVNYVPEFDENKNVVSIIVNSYDITESKQAELTINQQNKELQQLNADKDRFISVLAHDLRSSFCSAIGFLDLLTENIRQYDISEIEEFIKMIKISAKSTFKLLENILMWVKANSGKIPYEPKKTNFSTICENVISELILTAQTKKIVINHFVGEDIYVYADANMLSAILRNLVSNAIKFTNTDGRISIYAKPHAENITITISDNGVGISPQKLNKMFDITQNISTNGTSNEKGTGLGLLICKELIEKQGGRIWVESELGKGSDFKFTMPLFSKVENIEKVSGNVFVSKIQ
jgi:PAS domain S-box-containing protein